MKLLPATRPRLLVEELERRILYSADAAALLGLAGGVQGAEVRVLEPAAAAPAGASVTATEPQSSAREIIFIDSRVPDAMKLADELMRQRGDGATFDIVMLDADEDGIEQINRVLAGEHGLAAIHIISHGSDGAIDIGGTRLDAARLAIDTESVARWGRSLTDDGDLLLYGCDVAQGAGGRDFVQRLAGLTGADVAASSDLTGSAAIGGNWTLEFATGTIHTQFTPSTFERLQWEGVLATFTVTSTADTGAAGTLRWAITQANGNGVGLDTIDFSIGSGAQTITLVSGLTIDGQVTIDGRTQPGFAGTPLIRIDGGLLGFNGLTLTSNSDGSVIRSLVITRFADAIVTQAGADTITIAGNWIGTTGTGTGNAGRNTDDGLDLAGDNAIIGGTGANDRNVITNNADEGITSVGSGLVIQGNYIGLDPDGSTGGGNVDVGIAIFTGTGNTIGGLTAAERNVISMNNEGIEINSGGNVVQGNYVGTDSTGVLNRGNRVGDGIQINTGNNNSVGGTATGAGNLVAFNAGDGVEVAGGTGNAVLGNQIHSNTLLGINLGTAGVTANDANDADPGANNLQNFPVLSSVALEGTQVVIAGTLNSEASKTYRIEFFANTANDNEGQRYLGFTDVTTPAGAPYTVSFTATLTASVAAGEYITATATDPSNNTSEFSAQVSAGTGMAIWTNNTSNPQHAQWNGSGFGAAIAPNALGAWTHIQAAESPTRTEIIAVGVDASGIMRGEMWNGSSWTPFSFNDIVDLGTTGYQSFQLAYEQQSGDALLVWDNGTTGSASLSYRAWNGTTWSAAQTITTPVSGEGVQLRLAADPNSDSMILAVIGTPVANDYALVWNGSSWGNAVTLDTSTGSDGTEIHVAYEAHSGHGLVVYDADGSTNAINYRTWDGTSWSAEQTLVAPAGVAAGSDASFSVLASDPNSNRIALGIVASPEIWLAVWDGGAWTNTLTATTTAGSTSNLNIALAFEHDSGDLMAAYGKSGSNFVAYRTWTAAGGWSSETASDVNLNLAQIPHALTLSADPNSNQLMLATRDSGNDVRYALWTGSAWSTALGDSTADAGGAYAMPMAFVWYDNNRTPVIGTTSLSMAENNTLAGSVAASDADGDTRTYSIIGGADQALFTIDSASGALSFVSAPNYESPADSGANNVYDVIVLVTDGNGGTDSQSIAVTVTNVNEAPVIVNLGGDSLAYSEGAGALVIEQGGNAAVSDVDSTNFDTGTLTVSFSAGSDSAEDVLAIRNQGTGVGQIGVSGANVTYGGTTIGTFAGGSGGANLVVAFNGNATPAAAQALLRNISYQNTDTDAPTTGARTVRFVLTDGDGGSSGNHDTTVTVSGVNDAPVITSNGGAASAAVSIAENSTAVTTVTSTDVDGGTPLYGIAGVDAARFTIDASTGVLSFVAAPDYEAPTDAGPNNVYEVTVLVSDGSFSATQDIAVTVSDVSSTLVVTTTADNNDTGLGASFTAEQLNASRGADGLVSLREALIAANNTAGIDTVSFNIAGAGLHTINVMSALPTITDAIVIDASSEPDFAGTPVVELNGASAGAGVDGLRITAGGSTVRGLVINRFSDDGIEFYIGGGNTIAGNYIGTDATGNLDFGNGASGIRVESSANNLIGGTAAGARNVVSGNTGHGVFILGSSATGNVVQGNYVGTDSDGVAALGNAVHGVTLSAGASNNLIGGTTAAARNVISGNAIAGVRLASPTTSGNTIQGNFIGVDFTGAVALGNGSFGVIADSPNTTIGGTAAGAGNVIAGNSNHGVQIDDEGAGSVVQGNYIGTDLTGTLDLGNAGSGVYLNSASNVTVGGTAAGARNVISGNVSAGIYVNGGTGHVIQGNYIGTDVTGAAAIGNADEGINVSSGASNNTIGGTLAGAGNVISGNLKEGINISGATTTGNLVQGNLIGTNAGGTAALGNGNSGVTVGGSASNNSIGGTASNAGNTIAFNSGRGIQINSGSTGNAILGNSTHSNTGLGIDLGNDGVTLNDAGDGDSGANSLLNFPVIYSVVVSGGNVTITGEARAGATVEFFEAAIDTLDYGEGQTFIGRGTVSGSTPGAVDVSARRFSFTFAAGSLAVGDAVTATATDASNNTSEFALDVTATPVPPGVTVTPISVLPLGSEFLVNTTTTDNQQPNVNATRAVATDAAGNFVVVWESNLQDGSGWGVFARRFSADGMALGGEFQVAATTADNQFIPSVAMDAAGNFVVTWSSNLQDGDAYGVYARRYDANGTALGGEFQVNTYTTASQLTSMIAMAPDGRFVITWSSTAQDGSASGIYARRFDAAGAAQGSEFLVNTWTTDNQQLPAVAMDAFGNFVVTWTSNLQDGSLNGVYAQRFDALGNAIGSEFLVTNTTADSQLYADVALAADGRFVVTWESRGQDGDSYGIYARRYGADGSALGSEFQIHTSTVGSQRFASVAIDASANFVISWTSNGTDGSGNGVYAQRFNAAGVAQGGEFLVNTTTAGNQQYATLAMTPEGQFVVVWGGNGAGDADGVYARRYGLVTTEAGGSATFSVMLNSQPTADVTIPISTADPSEGTVSVSSLTFTALNWNVAQTVTVTGVQDFANDGNTGYSIVVGLASSSDVNYNGLDPADASVTNAEVANQAPVNSVPAAQSTNEDTTLVFSVGNGNPITLADADAGSNPLQVTLAAGNGTLTLGGTAGLTFTGGANGSASMSFTGTASAINTALNGLGFAPTANFEGAASLTITTNDQGNSGTGGAQSDVDAIDISVTAVNDAPVITTSGSTLAYIENGPAAAVDAAMTVSDADSANLASATVSIGSGFQIAEDTLAFTNQSGISGSWNSGTGVLTLSGSASVAQYQAALRSITYVNSSDNPSTTTRVVSFVVNDGSTNGNTATRNVSIAAVNDAPVATITPATYAATEQVALTLKNTGLVISDVDAAAGSMTVTLSVTEGTLTVTAGGSGALVSNSGTASVTITGTVTQINNLLSTDATSTVSYADGTDAPSASTTLTLLVNDNGNTGGGSLTNSDTATINITAVNDAPVLAAIGNQSVNEGATLSFSASATDADLPTQSLSYSLDAASLALGMTINAGTGAFSWTPTEAQGGTAPSVTVTATDNGTGNLTDSETFTITVGDLNDAPVLGAIGNQNINEGATLAFTASAIDPDLPAQSLSYSLDAASLALGMTINSSTGAFSWTPTEAQGGLTPSVTITVTDNGSGNLTDSETFTITVGDTNVAPVLAAIGNQSVNEGATLSFTASATDADLPADTLTYSLDPASLALGMIVNSSTGAFSWTPSEAQGGLTPSVTITVTDNGTGNLFDSETFTITVGDTNLAPVLGAIGNQSVNEGATLSFSASATDADLPSQTLSYSLDAASLALGMSINAGTGAFSWTPSEAQGGLAPSVTITVTDNGSGNLTDSETFTITVGDTNQAPVLAAIGNQSVNEGATLNFTASAIDTDLPSQTLSYSLDAASLALGMTINASTGVFSWNPTEAQGGLTPAVTVTVTDNGTGNLTDSETFTISVGDTNQAPVLGAIGNQAVNEGATLSFSASATDPDLPAQSLSYSLDAASLALGMTINSSTGAFSWTPTEAQGGLTPSVTVTVTDSGSGNLFDSETFTITVNDVNDAPILAAIGNQAVSEGATLSFSASATDADLPSQTLTYSLDAASLALGMTINASTGAFSWTPSEAQGGLTPAVTITVTDNGTGNLTDSETFTITVGDTNVAPVLGAIANQAVNEGATLSFSASATDADLPSQTLSYSLDAASLALGMTINSSTGAFSWTPSEAQGGLTPSVTVTVTDNGTGTLADSETFTITVGDTNLAPVLGAIGNQSVNEGATLSFTASASDADLPSQTLSYSLDAASLALGMTINASTGAFSWNPTEAQGGLTPAVTVTVTDNGTGNLFDSETFTITVADVNDAPVLVAIGNQSVNEGATLSFTASATDADLPADTLTFSLDAASLALGMSINSSTGAFSWTPTEAQGGLTPTVTVTVTDSGSGNLFDSETFTITVNDLNDAPALAAIGNQSVNEGLTLSFTASATDADLPGNTLTYSLDAASLALGMTINSSTGAFSWTPSEAQGGLAPSVTITVTDNGSGNLFDSETFTITVSDLNDAPALAAIGNQSVNEGATLSITASATDADLPADTLTYSLDAASLALGMTINSSTGAFSWTPTEAQGGLTPAVTVTVTDSGSGNLFDSETFTITVGEVNDVPTTSAVTLTAIAEDSGPRVITQAELLANAVDADGPSLTATSLVISSGTGTLVDNGDGTWSYAPALNDVSSVSFSYTVTDGIASVAGSATLDITPVNDAPTTSAVTLAPIAEDGGARVITQAELLSNAADVDGPSLSATGLVIASGTGSLVDNGDSTWTYTPALNDDTAVTVSYTVTDGSFTAVASATLDISPVNDAPVLAIASLTLQSGQSLLLSATQLRADDVDSTPSTLVFEIGNVIAGQFELVANAGVPITQFTQNQLTLGQVRFVQTSIAQVPSFDVTAFDGSARSASISVVAGVVAPSLPPAPPIDTTPVPSPAVQAPADVPIRPLTSEREQQATSRGGTAVSAAAGDAANALGLDGAASNYVADAQSRVRATFSNGEPADGSARTPGVLLVQSFFDLDLSIDAEAYLLQAARLPLVQLLQAAAQDLSTGVTAEPTHGSSVSTTEDGGPVITVQAAQATGVALSVGAVWWALRAGGLLASLLSTLPTWRHVDLLAVLPDEEDDDEWDGEGDDEAMRDERAVGDVLEPALGTDRP